MTKINGFKLWFGKGNKINPPIQEANLSQNRNKLF